MKRHVSKEICFKGRGVSETLTAKIFSGALSNFRTKVIKIVSELRDILCLPPEWITLWRSYLIFFMKNELCWEFEEMSDFQKICEQCLLQHEVKPYFEYMSHYTSFQTKWFDTFQN